MKEQFAKDDEIVNKNKFEKILYKTSAKQKYIIFDIKAEVFGESGDQEELGGMSLFICATKSIENKKCSNKTKLIL